jgi:hypothetical protein
MAKFFRFPWATTGDKTEIPDPTDAGGAVSYAQGFGPDYERDPETDPLAKRIPRSETNQYLFDVTDNLRQYQLHGVPDWYPASANGGASISYPIGSRVRHNDLVYASLVTGNTVEPGTDATKWALDDVVQNATEARFGKVRLATTAEAAARTATDRVVTPAGLGALFNLLLNNPVFPEVLTDDGLFDLSSPSSGTLRVEAGTQFVHRGAFTYTSAETDLPTLANKTYHLRWTPTGGFVLRDLSNGTYNPSALAETNAAFDTTRDDMLIARITTSAGNVLTITPLVNLARLAVSQRTSGTIVDGGAGNRTLSTSLTLNWSRTADVQAIAGNVASGNPVPAGAMDGYAAYIQTRSVTRYAATASVLTDWETGTSTGSLIGYIDYALSA